MREQLLDLFAVQQIDLEIRDIEKCRDDIPCHLTELESKVALARQELEQLNLESEGLTNEIKALEGAVYAENHKIRLWEKRLNDIRNQREYLALSRETESSKRANRSNEEQIVELMAKREDVNARAEAVGDKLAETEVDCDAERERVREATEKSESIVTSQKARREALLHKIPAPLLRKYEHIRKKRAELGLTPAADGRCTACNMRLPPQLYNILQRVDTIEQCPSCQRIVFYVGILEEAENAHVGQESTAEDKTALSAEATPQ